MREEEIIHIISAQDGWCAYGHDEQGSEFLAPVACWALVESSGNVRHVVGMTAHGSPSVERAEDLPGFAEYRFVSKGSAA